MKIDPRELEGPWVSGFALDVHSTSSELVGYDEFGHEQFRTHRTDIGELLYRVKYKGDDAALAKLVRAMSIFARSQRIDADLVVPVPPTRARAVQPLYRICDGIGSALGVPVARTAVRKAGGSELKNLWALEERTEALKGTVTVNAKTVAGKTVLLVDDLVRSGATIRAVSAELQRAGARAVHVLVATETRKK